MVPVSLPGVRTEEEGGPGGRADSAAGAHQRAVQSTPQHAACQDGRVRRES